MLTVGIEATGFRQLAKDVRRADKTLAANLRKHMKSAGELVATDWRARESWSSRIPGTIRVSSTQKGVSVKGGGAKAPHLAPYESPNGVFRHPVHGGPAWVEQQARPGGLPALQAHLDDAAEAAAKALDDWAAEAGFH